MNFKLLSILCALLLSPFAYAQETRQELRHTETIEERCFLFFTCSSVSTEYKSHTITPVDGVIIEGDADISGSLNDFQQWMRGEGADTTGSGFGRSAVNVNGGIGSYIIAIGVFINYTLIPFLFALALLFFLYNIFNYYINSGNTEKRDEAKRAAIYGIAAFVFLVSIWGIVNLFVRSLNIDQPYALCPDYLGSWCGRGTVAPQQDVGPRGVITDDPNKFLDSRGPITPDGETPPLVDFGCGSGEDCDEEYDVPNDYSGMAELLYGEYRDDAGLNFRSGPPQAQASTALVSSSLSCTEGLELLIQAADVETNQAAFAFYTQTDGTTRWQNLTDATGRERIRYDADTINDIVAAGGTDILLVHTHPQARAEAARINLVGHGPSASDYELLCEGPVQDMTLATVDWSGVWRTSQNAALVCPRRVAEEDAFRLVDTFYLLSMVGNDARNDQFKRLLNSDLVPRQYQADLLQFESTNFNRLSSEEVRGLVDTNLAEMRLQSTRSTAAAVCSSR